MDKLHHILVLIVIWAYFDNTYAQLTVEETQGMMNAVRDACQKTFPVDKSLIDEANSGRYRDDRNLKCYVNCVFQSLRIVKRGKMTNPELLSKHIKIYLPMEFQPEWLRAIEACKDVEGAGDDLCENGIPLAKCFTENNDHFRIP